MKFHLSTRKNTIYKLYIQVEDESEEILKTYSDRDLFLKDLCKPQPNGICYYELVLNKQYWADPDSKMKTVSEHRFLDF